MPTSRAREGKRVTKAQKEVGINIHLTHNFINDTRETLDTQSSCETSLKIYTKSKKKSMTVKIKCEIL